VVSFSGSGVSLIEQALQFGLAGVRGRQRPQIVMQRSRRRRIARAEMVVQGEGGLGLPKTQFGLARVRGHQRLQIGIKRLSRGAKVIDQVMRGVYLLGIGLR